MVCGPLCDLPPPQIFSPVFLICISPHLTKIFRFPLTNPLSFQDPEAGSGVPQGSSSPLDAPIPALPTLGGHYLGMGLCPPLGQGWEPSQPLLSPPSIALHGARHTAGTLGMWVESFRNRKERKKRNPWVHQGQESCELHAFWSGWEAAAWGTGDWPRPSLPTFLMIYLKVGLSGLLCPASPSCRLSSPCGLWYNV